MPENISKIFIIKTIRLNLHNLIADIIITIFIIIFFWNLNFINRIYLKDYI